MDETELNNSPEKTVLISGYLNSKTQTKVLTINVSKEMTQKLNVRNTLNVFQGFFLQYFLWGGRKKNIIEFNSASKASTFIFDQGSGL